MVSRNALFPLATVWAREMRPGEGIVLAVLACGLALSGAQTASAKPINGTNRSDNIVGTTRADEIEARGGLDAVSGRAGRDWIHGNGAADAILGNNGGDWIWGDGGDDVLDGGVGNDRIWGGWGGDAIEGGGGNDVINSSENDGLIDSVDCGPGTDRVLVGRSDRVFNCETVRRFARGLRVPAGRSWIGSDVLDDKRHGTVARDYMAGLGGDDLLWGEEKHDILWGNVGDDTLNGDHGIDRLLGGLGHDMLLGSPGSDSVVGGRGLDMLFGDAGDDVLYSIEVDGVADQVDCGENPVGRPSDFDRAFVRVGDTVAANCEWWRVFR
jgi:Ca2+-binding RTX toxin-like protein